MTPCLADTPVIETERLALRAVAGQDIDPENIRSIALVERLGCTQDPDATLPELPDREGALICRHTATEHA